MTVRMGTSELGKGLKRIFPGELAPVSKLRRVPA